VELADVVVAAASLCWAQAPKLNALAKTAIIMIAFNSFNLISPPFRAGCFDVLGDEHS